MRSWQQKRQRQRGQTVVEYLLLLALAFIVTYILVAGPMAFGTKAILTTIRNSLANINQNADLNPGQLVQPGSADHPSAPARAKRLH